MRLKPGGKRTVKHVGIRGYIDHRRSFEVAEVAGDMLDELEDHLNNGAAEVVRRRCCSHSPSCARFWSMSMIRPALSATQCQRSADLYARACRLGARTDETGRGW